MNFNKNLFCREKNLHALEPQRLIFKEAEPSDIAVEPDMPSPGGRSADVPVRGSRLIASALLVASAFAVAPALAKPKGFTDGINDQNVAPQTHEKAKGPDSSEKLNPIQEAQVKIEMENFIKKTAVIGGLQKINIMSGNIFIIRTARLVGTTPQAVRNYILDPKNGYPLEGSICFMEPATLPGFPQLTEDDLAYIKGWYESLDLNWKFYVQHSVADYSKLTTDTGPVPKGHYTPTLEGIRKFFIPKIQERLAQREKDVLTFHGYDTTSRIDPMDNAVLEQYLIRIVNKVDETAKKHHIEQSNLPANPVIQAKLLSGPSLQKFITDYPQGILGATLPEDARGKLNDATIYPVTDLKVRGKHIDYSVDRLTKRIYIKANSVNVKHVFAEAAFDYLNAENHTADLAAREAAKSTPTPASYYSREVSWYLAGGGRFPYKSDGSVLKEQRDMAASLMDPQTNNTYRMEIVKDPRRKVLAEILTGCHMGPSGDFDRPLTDAEISKPPYNQRRQHYFGSWGKPDPNFWNVLPNNKPTQQTPAAPTIVK